VGQGLTKFFYVADLDYSWLAKFLSLLLLPLAHEDLAILLGGYLLVNQLMPVGFVVIGIYLGMVASDMSLYWIGAGARHIPWLNRLRSTSASRVSATSWTATCSALLRSAAWCPAWCSWS
jgi:membrane protein DedA with SNARE-associated domain